MGKIHQLPESLVNKIAAGEVVERPAFALKELVENSLDAKASEIIINLEKSGLKKIQVIDDGEGMSKEDLVKCFKPHTTSKISKEEDLLKINSLGFRGEALSSIASISQMEIKSRTREDLVGNQVNIIYGKVEKVVPSGMPVGTNLIVNNLFSNVPARQKFLKNPQVEYRLILDLLTGLALAHQKTAFKISHNGKVVFDLPKNQELFDRIKVFLNPELYENLFPLNSQQIYLQVSGFLGKPQIASISPKRQYIFVNQRRINNKLISQAVKEAYGSLISSDSYPVFILSFNIPVEIVDVNIHPRKEEVSFGDNNLIIENVKQSIIEELNNQNLTFSNLNFKGNIVDTFAGELLKDTTYPWIVKDNSKVSKSSDILQTHNLYLISQTPNGLVFIDQHAAHERILYEQFLVSYQTQKDKLKSFKLPKPLIIDLSLNDTELLKDSLKKLQKLGFEIEHFKDNSFLVSSLPYLLKDQKPLDLISEILEDLLEGKDPKDLNRQTQKMLAYLACRAAIKAGEKLTKKESKKLVAQLEKTPNNYTCPHGRPTKITTSLEKIHKAFKRK